MKILMRVNQIRLLMETFRLRAASDKLAGWIDAIGFPQDATFPGRTLETGAGSCTLVIFLLRHAARYLLLAFFEKKVHVLISVTVFISKRM